MPTDGRDNGKAESERELAHLDAELVVREEGATLEELTDSLNRLRQLLTGSNSDSSSLTIVTKALGKQALKRDPGMELDDSEAVTSWG